MSADLDIEALIDAAVHAFAQAVATGHLGTAGEVLDVVFELAAAMEGGNRER